MQAKSRYGSWSIIKWLLVQTIKGKVDIFDGVAMSSPLGPVLANIFMCYLEEKWVLSNNTRPSIWFRFG